MYDNDDPIRVTAMLSERVDACRSVLRGDRSLQRRGRSMFDREVVSFAHGDGLAAPDFTVVAAGIEALLDQARFPLSRYNFLERHEGLEDVIRATMRSEGFPDSHHSSLCVDSGTTKLLQSFLRSVTEAGDAVLVAPTFYHGLVGWARLMNLGLQLVSTSAGYAHKLEPQAIETAIHNAKRWARRTSALVVFNPTQTGAMYTAAELDAISDCCAQYDLDVIEDSIFGRTRFDQKTPLAHLASSRSIGERVVTVDGCSKADGLANARIGWAAGPPMLLDKMERVKAATTVGIPYVTLEMARAALLVPRTVREADATECAHRAAAVIGAVQLVNAVLDGDDRERPAIVVVHPPEAGHSILLDVSGLGVRSDLLAWPNDSLDVTERWLDRAAVAVSPMCSSGLCGSEIRLNFACVTDPLEAKSTKNASSHVPAGVVRAAAFGDRGAVDHFLRSLDTLATAEARPTGRVLEVIRHSIVDRVGAAHHDRVLVGASG